MLTNLLKYEFKASGRVVLPIASGVLVLNIFTGILSHFIQNTSDRFPLAGLALVLLNLAALVSLLVVLAVCFFIEVQQFYRLLGDRGYLMLALPVHAWQHIAAKLICGVVWTLFGFFYFGICGTLTLSALDGDGFSITGVNIKDVPLLLLFFLLILALIAGAQLHTYLACAYAGMFTQHRLIISIISYFGQMLVLVGTIVFAMKVYPSLDNIGSMVELQNGILISVCVIFLLVLLVDALLWALTQWLMSEQLNLA